MKTIRALTLGLVVLIAISSLQLLVPRSAWAAASQLRITELMYDPNGNGDREFVEIYNGGDVSINLSTMTMVGVDFTFPAGTTLAAGQYGVIVRNSAVFQANNPGRRVFGQYAGKLLGSGESVQIISAGQVMSQVDYQFGGAWPSSPKNGGPSLSLIRPDANEALAACWAPSASSGGTPAAVNSVDTSWSTAHSGGCGTKAYPTTAAAPPTTTAPPQVQAAQQKAAAAAQQQAAAEQAKQKEQAKVEQQAKVEAAVAAQAAQQVQAANVKRAKDSKTRLLGAIIGTTTTALLVGGLLLYKKLHHRRAFKKIIQKQQLLQHHETKA